MRGRKIVVGETKVTLYVRHKKNCPLRADNSGTVNCDCIRWLQYKDGSRGTTSAWTWAKAEEEARRKVAEREGLEGTPGRHQTYTVEKAVDEWIAEREQDQLDNRKAVCLTARLIDWCRRNGIEQLNQIQKQALRSWRTTEWKYRTGDSSSLKVHWSVLGSFFAWCVEGDLLSANPFPKRKGKIKQREVVPLTPAQMDALLAAVERIRMPGWNDKRRLKMRALILTMRWSGMAIHDSVCLERAHLINGRIRNKRRKTGQQFYVPIPKWLSDLLEALPNDDPRYFFWYHRADGTPVRRNSVVTAYGGWFRDVFKEAGIQSGHSHQLRHTFATHHLSIGQRVERVAEWLGHDPSETRKTYKHWVKEMQDLSDEAMRKSWEKMGLDALGNPVAP